MLDVAGRGDDELVAAVATAVVAGDRRTAHRLDRGDRAEHRATERIARPDQIGERVVHRVAGIVVMHGDLFENHAALVVDLLRGQHRRQHHVADDVDRDRQVGVEHPRVVAGVFLGSERVELAADLVERRRDRQRVASLRALEPIHTPKATDRTPLTASLMTRIPPGSTVRRTTAPSPPVISGRVEPTR